MSDSSSYVTLSLDGTTLAFAREEIAAFDVLSDVRLDATRGPAIGALERDGVEIPVYALSAGLEPLDGVAAGQRFCVCLATQDPEGRCAIACDEVAQLRLPDPAAVHPLPDVMRSARLPIRALLRIDDRVAFVCTAESFSSYLATAGETHV